MWITICFDGVGTVCWANCKIRPWTIQRDMSHKAIYRQPVPGNLDPLPFACSHNLFDIKTVFEKLLVWYQSVPFECTAVVCLQVAKQVVSYDKALKLNQTLTNGISCCFLFPVYRWFCLISIPQAEWEEKSHHVALPQVFWSRPPRDGVCHRNKWNQQQALLCFTVSLCQILGWHLW